MGRGVLFFDRPGWVVTAEWQPTWEESTLPLLGVFSIESCAGHDPAELRVEQSSASRAITLVNHVMGSGTGAALLERNILEAVSGLVEAIPGGRLRYPHGRDGPDQVRRLIVDNLNLATG